MEIGPAGGERPGRGRGARGLPPQGPDHPAGPGEGGQVPGAREGVESVRRLVPPSVLLSLVLAATGPQHAFEAWARERARASEQGDRATSSKAPLWRERNGSGPSCGLLGPHLAGAADPRGGARGRQRHHLLRAGGGIVAGRVPTRPARASCSPRRAGGDATTTSCRARRSDPGAAGRRARVRRRGGGARRRPRRGAAAAGGQGTDAAGGVPGRLGSARGGRLGGGHRQPVRAGSLGVARDDLRQGARDRRGPVRRLHPDGRARSTPATRAGRCSTCAARWWA